MARSDGVVKNSIGMKNMVLVICILSLKLTSGQADVNDLERFNNVLGPQKSAALDSAVASFQTFLELNYEGGEGIRDFLVHIRDSMSFDKTWVLPTKRNQKILADWEETGLRKDIWLYDDEPYEVWQVDSTSSDTLVLIFEDEIIPIANRQGEEQQQGERSQSLYRNNLGLFMTALAKSESKSQYVTSYIDAIEVAGDINPGLSANAFLQEITNFNNPLALRIFVVEFYYGMMVRDVERE